MKRAKPMKRSGFKPLRAPRPAKVIEGYTPQPRPVAQPARPGPAAVSPLRPSGARAPVAVPKFAYVRDTRLRDMCRGMRCQHCGAHGKAAGVTWAHSNQAIHGKGGSIKASDVFVAALCWTCHRELDQGSQWSQEEKTAIWNDAHIKTVVAAVRKDTWPVGIALPVEHTYARTARGQQKSDYEYLALLRERKVWMSADDVAFAMAMSRHMVVHALRRLADAGELEEEVVNRPGSARTQEHSRVYRASLQLGEVRHVQNGMPSWLAPHAIVAIGEPRRVVGRAGMKRFEAEDYSSRPGMPGGPENGAASTKESAESPAGAADDPDVCG